ncbi:MAG: hypothetical protein AB7S49_11305 [Arcobacter sp.]|uniref:hypothetical protein n=1 Tax=Pseudomonadati TaxID=3379134 RepID=UPI003CFEEB1E
MIKNNTQELINRDPIEAVKAAYLMLSSLNYITIEHGEQKDTIDTINIINAIFYDSINLIEKNEKRVNNE